MRIEMLGVPVDAVTREGAARTVEGLLAEGRGCLVTTPNPEMLVAATKDEAFRRALSRADLAVADGIGLLWAARTLGKRLPERVSGVDLMGDLCAVAAMRGLRVALLGGKPGVAERAGAVLVRRYPGLNVVAAEDGGVVAVSGDGIPHIDGVVLERLRASAPDLLFVAFGHGVQEKWLVAHLGDLPSVRVGMGVGGAFDFIAGDVQRAPAWVRRLGIEWLWRLILQPWRWKRIWTAVVVFPWTVLMKGRG